MCSSAGTFALTIILWGLILGCTGAIISLLVMALKDALADHREQKAVEARKAEARRQDDIRRHTGLCRWCRNTHLDPWKYNYEPPTPFLYSQISYSCLLIGQLKRESDRKTAAEAVEEAVTRRRYRDDWHRNFESNHNIIWKRHLEAQVLKWLTCGETYIVADWVKPKMRWHYGKTWPEDRSVRWQFWADATRYQERWDWSGRT